jgi:hypothetical protein
LSGKFLILGTAVGVATAAIGKFSAAGSEAIQRQVEQVSSLATAMQTLGLNQQQAGKYTQGVESAIAKLGRDLPVSSENIQVFFRTIQDDYNIALKGAGASLATIQKAQLSSSSRIAILSELAGGDVGASRAAISAFLGGSVGKGGLSQYTFFGNNPQLSSAIKAGLEKKGVDSSGDLSALERVKLLTSALEKTVTPEMIDLLQGTVKARLSAFTDSLFDPTIGLFSIQRDLEPKIDGYQSVFTSFGDTLDILIGNSGIVSNLTRLLGIGSLDPMRSLYNGMNAFNAWLLGVNSELSKFKKLTAVDAGAFIGRLFSQVANFFNDSTKGALSSLSSQDYKSLFKGIFVGIGAFVSGINYKTLLVDIPFEILKLGTSVVGGLLGAAYDITLETGAKLKSVLFQKISDFVDKISKIVEGLLTSVTEQVTGINLGGNNQQPGQKQTASSVAQSLAVSGLKTAVSASTNPVGTLGGILGGIVGRFFSRADGFIPANQGLTGALLSEAARKPSGSDFVIANSSETILNPNQAANIAGKLNRASIGNLNITLNLPGGTSLEIAQQAIAIIEQQLNRELDSAIA